MASVALSPSAEREIRRLWRVSRGSEEGAVPACLRLSVGPGGCHEFAYALGFETEAMPQDRAIASCGLTIAVDPESFARLAGANLTIDYAEDLIGGAFRFEAVGGTEREHCDCGASFRLVARARPVR